MDKRLVKVIWLDAHASSTTAYAEHEIPHSAIEIQTVGWLLRQDDAGISVANEYCADATYRGYTFVPTALIKSVEDVVKPAKKRTKRLVAPPDRPQITSKEVETPSRF